MHPAGFLAADNAKHLPGLFSHLKHHDHPAAPQPLPHNYATKSRPAKTERAPSLLAGF